MRFSKISLVYLPWCLALFVCFTLRLFGYSSSETSLKAPPALTISGLASFPCETSDWLSHTFCCRIDELVFKSSTICATVETAKGRKFIKVHAYGQGIREMVGAELLKTYLPVIEAEEVIPTPPFECLVQPYIYEVDQSGGMLYDYFYLFPKEALGLLDDVIQSVSQIVHSSIRIGKARASNDRLYWDRVCNNLEANTRHIQRLYEGKELLGIPWRQLLAQHLVVNGVTCSRTLEDVLKEAKAVLSPDCRRALSICHGDWHDMNICVRSGKPHFLDCELAGINDPIGDAAVFLVYNAIQGDYLGPKYHPAHFPHRGDALKTINLDRSPISWHVEEGRLLLESFDTFGATPCRKDAAVRFVRSYFTPSSSR